MDGAPYPFPAPGAEARPTPEEANRQALRGVIAGSLARHLRRDRIERGEFATRHGMDVETVDLILDPESGAVSSDLLWRVHAILVGGSAVISPG
jgi:hypothetical protein